MSFGKFREISFKLKSQINIDELYEKENFEMKRCYMQDNLNALDHLCSYVALGFYPMTSIRDRLIPQSSRFELEKK